MREDDQTLFSTVPVEAAAPDPVTAAANRCSEIDCVLMSVITFGRSSESSVAYCETSNC
jgi:hypothetical protein